jgi:hypothetical protein
MKSVKTILSYQPSLREKAIQKMSTPLLAKAAAGLVKDYNLDPE